MGIGDIQWTICFGCCLEEQTMQCEHAGENSGNLEKPLANLRTMIYIVCMEMRNTTKNQNQERENEMKDSDVKTVTVTCEFCNHTVTVPYTQNAERALRMAGMQYSPLTGMYHCTYGCDDEVLSPIDTTELDDSIARIERIAKS